MPTHNEIVKGLVQTLKPAAPARVHLLLAGLMWTVVGAVLAVLGTFWALRRPTLLMQLLVAAAVLAGVVKSLSVLDRAARKIALRIETRGDGRCVGGFLSWRSWLLVAIMAGTGRLLRSGIVALRVVGLLYVAVGVALLLSSRVLWTALRSHSATG
jgi:hypothetical protein